MYSSYSSAVHILIYRRISAFIHFIQLSLLVCIVCEFYCDESERKRERGRECNLESILLYSIRAYGLWVWFLCSHLNCDDHFINVVTAHCQPVKNDKLFILKIINIFTHFTSSNWLWIRVYLLERTVIYLYFKLDHDIDYKLLLTESVKSTLLFFPCLLLSTLEYK